MDEQLRKYIENNELLKARRKIDELLFRTAAERKQTYYLAEKAAHYIEENHEKALTLPEVACFVGLTPNYFCRMFQMHTGMRFKTYLNFTRIKHAEILLLTTDLRIASISERVGYSDSSYFIRQFQRHTHYTPARFRQLYYRYRGEL